MLLSPTPPTMPPPPPPTSEEDGEPEVADKPEMDKPEMDKPEVVGEEMDGKAADDEEGEHVAAGHHESRVTLSGPLQFMGRSDLPRDGDATPPAPLSPVASPVKLLDVLPATLRDAAAVEASLGRAVPVTSGSIDAVSADDCTQPSPWSGLDETSTRVDDQPPDVFGETPTTTVDRGGDDEPTTKTGDVVASPDAVDAPTSVDVPDLVTAEAAETVNGVSRQSRQYGSGMKLTRTSQFSSVQLSLVLV